MSIQPDPMGEELKHYQSDLSGLASLIEALLNNTGAGIYIVQDKNFIYVNPFFEELSGYTMQELADTPSLNLVYPDDRDMVRKKVTKILKKKSKDNTYEYRFVKKNGEVVWVLERITSMEYMGQRAAMGSFMDINQRKVLEEALAASEERYRAIIEQMHDSCFGLDLDGNFIFINESVCCEIGYAREELIGKNANMFVPEENRKARRKEFTEVLRTGKPKINTISRVTRNNGEIYYLESSISLLKSPGGDPVGYLCVGRDITERKALEEALAASEERYRSMLDRMLDSYYEVDLAGNFTFLNAATYQNLVYEKGELDGKNYRIIIPEDEIDNIFSAFHRVYETGEPNLGFSHKILRKDGSIGFAESSIGLLQDKQGHPIGFSCLGRDVSERRKLQDDLKRSEERYRSVLEQMPDMYYEVDLKGSYTYVNNAFCKFTGYSSQELLSSNFRQIDDPALLDFIYEKFNEVFRTGQTNKGFSYRLVAKDGTEKYIEVSVRLLKNEDGKARGFSCFSRDVTERTRLENELQRSEEKYRTMLEQMQDGYYEVDLKGNYTFANTAAANFIGVPKEQLIGTNFRAITPSDGTDEVFQAYNQVFKSGIPNTAFAHQVIKEGQVKYRESSIDLRRNQRGEVIGFKSVVRDVTERKLLEAALRQSEEQYRTMLEQMQDGYYEVDLKGNYTFANTAAGNILGVPKEKLIGINYRVLAPPDEVSRVFQAYNEVYKSGIPNTGFAHQITIKDGQSILCESSIDVRRNEHGEVIGFKSVARDVTERKMLEAALRLSEEKYRTILEEMQDAYYEVDLSGNFTFVNEATARHTGYTAEELTKMNFRQVTYEEDINPVFTAYNNVYRSGEPNKGYSHRMIKKDGTVGYVEAAISVLKDKQGAIAGFRCVSRDVTVRKMLEQKLADMATHDFLTGLPNRILLNDRFQVALAQANRNNYKLGIMSLDLDHFKEVNDSMGHAVGDQLLKAVGTRLSNILRSSDTVARVGGDEFLLLLQEIHYPEDAILIAEKIIDSCKEPLHINGFELHISTSIGIAIYPDNGEDMDTLMRKSDAAMYFSKRHGGMQYKVFTTSDQLDISLP